MFESKTNSTTGYFNKWKSGVEVLFVSPTSN